ncbi:hypothetical protein [Umezawaea beigongshangensis]|uniref:hypothetical protein n=1 Tax=Umezawaea beigongshangensis TaxID=2780383 RepID=UPI0018F27453|nr:hypothetical protein [Umezawaea beigongshangensis]
MNHRRDSTDGPEDVDAAFAEIVASLEREGVGSAWSATGFADDSDEQPDTSPAKASTTEPRTPVPGRDAPESEASTPDAPAPEPPPEPGGRGREDTALATRPEDDLDDQRGRTAPDDGPDDHFVPPEPPPMPSLRPGTIAALGVVLLGVVLLVAPGLFGLRTSISAPLALVAMCTGAGWLILRLRHDPPPDSGWDDGARL